MNRSGFQGWITVCVHSAFQLHNELNLPLCIPFFGRIFTTKRPSSSHTKKFCEKNAPQSPEFQS
jgi:hypothetical protein